MAWVDGRVTAGYQGAPVKFNQQIDERLTWRWRCQRIVGRRARESIRSFISAVLPNEHLPADVQPLRPGHEVRRAMSTAACASTRTTARKLRTDVSATLFLTNPEDYDGGELRSRTPTAGTA